MPEMKLLVLVVITCRLWSQVLLFITYYKEQNMFSL